MAVETHIDALSFLTSLPGRIGAATLLAALVLFCAACDDSGKQAEEVAFPEVTPFPMALAEQVHAIRDQTAAVRGLPANLSISEGILPRDALADYLDAAAKAQNDDETQRLQSMQEALRLLRMIGPNDDLTQIVRSFQSEQVSGIYSLEADRLAIVGDPGELDVEAELTLSHEYVHSFQDGAFSTELERLNELTRQTDSEYPTTVPCLLEGDATLASFQYMNRTHGPLWIAQLLGSVGEITLPEGVPDAITRYLAFNYSECVVFVQNVQARDGWAGVNELYKRPPASTEQVLHADKYRANEMPAALTLPDLSKALGSGWKRGGLSSFGEFDVLNYLMSLGATRAQAAQAAAGWGGGSIVVYSKSEAHLAHVALQFDNASELAQFRSRYATSLDGVAGLDRSESDGGATWSWRAESDFGRVLWNDADVRVDIVLARDDALVERAVAGLR